MLAKRTPTPIRRTLFPVRANASTNSGRIFTEAGEGGRPCIRGMRIRVKDILEALAGGANEAKILESFPYLEREDIQAALEYAAQQADHVVLSLAE